MRLWFGSPLFWAIVVGLYPLLVLPGVSSRTESYFLKLTFLSSLLFIALLQALWQHRHLSLKTLGFRALGYIRLPFVALALLYALWTLIASAYSPFPPLSLLGSSDDYQDGALAEVLFALSAVAAYFGGRGALKGVRLGIVGAGLLLALWALVEVWLRKGLYYPVATVDLPLGSFPGKGHLAGFLLLSLPPMWPAWGPSLVTALSLGVTYTRAALLGLAFAWLMGVRRPPYGLGRHLALGVGLILAVAGGLYLGRHLQVSGGKELSSGTTLETRLILWTIAGRGIAEKPWTGFGGGVFYLYWTHFATIDEISRLLWLEKRLKVLEVRGMAVLAQKEDGQKVLVRTDGWKAHNELLDLALMWGVPGALLFVVLTLGAMVSGLRGGEALLALGLGGYLIFSFLWYVPAEVKGTLWPLLGGLWALRCGGEQRRE